MVVDNPFRRRLDVMSMVQSSLLMVVFRQVVPGLVVWAGALSAGVAWGQSAAGAAWPQFLGPQRDGISIETGLIDAWPADGPREVWRVPGGVGMSGVVVEAGLAVTMVQGEGMQRLVALDAADGTTRWSTGLARAYSNQMGNGPRATPAIADGKVFALSGEGILCAVSLKDGELLWQENVVQRHQGEPAPYGMACSPLVWDGQVIVTIGAAQATVIACDPNTGKTVWTSGKDEAAGYSSPAVRKVNGQNQLVVFAGASVAGLNPGDGQRLWRFPYVTDYDCNIMTPVSIGNDVLISAGENHGSTLLRAAMSDGSWKASEVWASTGTGSVLRNEWQTPVLLDGYLYGFDNVGSAGPVTHLTCVDAKTGKRVWQQARFGKGNLIAADGKLFISTMKGDVVLVRATPESFQELGRGQYLETTRQAPSLSFGRLYLRDDADIVCLNVRAN